MTAEELQDWLGPDLEGVENAVELGSLRLTVFSEGPDTVAVWPEPGTLGLGRYGRLRALQRLFLGSPLPVRYAITPYVKLVTYVPEGYQDRVRDHVTAAGAGHIGDYSDCTYMASGEGTFRPGDHTRPFIGQQGELERVREWRLETIVPRWRLDYVVNALLSVHPYEEVAYDVIPLANALRLPYGYQTDDTWIVPEMVADVVVWAVRARPREIRVEKISWAQRKTLYAAGIRVVIEEPGSILWPGVEKLWHEKRPPWA